MFPDIYKQVREREREESFFWTGIVYFIVFADRKRKNCRNKCHNSLRRTIRECCVELVRRGLGWTKGERKLRLRMIRRIVSIRRCFLTLLIQVLLYRNWKSWYLGHFAFFHLRFAHYYCGGLVGSKRQVSQNVGLFCATNFSQLELSGFFKGRSVDIVPSKFVGCFFYAIGHNVIYASALTRRVETKRCFRFIFWWREMNDKPLTRISLVFFRAKFCCLKVWKKEIYGFKKLYTAMAKRNV